MKHPFQSVPAGSSYYTPPHHRAVKNMKMNKLAALFIIAIIVSPNLTIVRGQTLTLVPFDVGYEPGEDISISGTATATANLTLVVIFNSTALYKANFTAKGDGNYSEEYEIPDNTTEGTYTVTVSDGGESVDADFTVASGDASDDSMELAETLIEQAEDLKDNVEDAFDDVEDVEVLSDANSSYLQGIEYLNMAREDFDEGNYTGASDMAFEAIQLFGDAYEMVSALQPQVEPVAGVDDDPEGSQDLNGIPAALERAFAYWDNLDAAVGQFEDNGYYVSEVRRVLKEAWDALEESRVHVEEGDFAAAREDFTRGRRVLGRINGLMNSSMKERKEKQVVKFLAQFQRRVEKNSATVNGLQGNLAASKAKKVKAVLESTAETLLNMSNSLSSGNMTDVLDDLDDAVEELEDGLDELNGEGLSKQIKTVYRFRARIESLNESLQRMADAGYNTSELDDYLVKAQSLLSHIEETIREGNEEAAEELIEDAESLVEEVQELFKKLQMNTRNATRVTGNSRGRSGNPGLGDEDEEDGIEDGQDVGGNVTSSSETVSDEVTEEIRELVGVISRIEESLVNLSLKGENTTDIEIRIENARTLIEEAKALAEKNPGEAKELMEAAEELLDDAIELIEGKTETESNVSVAAFEPDDGDDDDEKDDDEEDSTSAELPDDEPDEVEISG